MKLIATKDCTFVNSLIKVLDRGDSARYFGCSDFPKLIAWKENFYKNENEKYSLLLMQEVVKTERTPSEFINIVPVQQSCFLPQFLSYLRCLKYLHHNSIIGGSLEPEHILIPFIPGLQLEFFMCFDFAYSDAPMSPQKHRDLKNAALLMIRKLIPTSIDNYDFVINFPQLLEELNLGLTDGRISLPTFRLINELLRVWEIMEMRRSELIEHFAQGNDLRIDDIGAWENFHGLLDTILEEAGEM